MSFFRNLVKPGLRKNLRNGDPIEIFSNYSDYCTYIRESKPSGSRHRFAQELLHLYERYEMETDFQQMRSSSSSGLAGMWRASSSKVDHDNALEALRFARRAVQDFEGD